MRVKHVFRYSFGLRLVAADLLWFEVEMARMPYHCGNSITTRVWKYKLVKVNGGC